jgi:DNA-binding transcriptional LysR family regulator
VGIVVNPARNPDLIMTLLCEDEVTMWQSKSCRNPDVLFVEPSLLQTQFILNKLKKEKAKSYRLIESASLDVIAKLVINGAGRGLLPRRVLLAANGEQCGIVKGVPKFLDKVYLIYKNEFRQMMRGKVFIENLKKMRF